MRITSIIGGLVVAVTAAGCVDGGDDAAPAEEEGDAVEEGVTQAAVTGPVGPIGPYFTQPQFCNRDVTGVAKAANSDRIIAALKAAGGWGNSNRMQVDYSLDVVKANASTPRRTFTPTEDFYSPDCDRTAVPIPVGGNLEGETGYACTTDGDCHLIVHDTSANKLYEMWRANITSVFYGGCLAVWDGTKAYTDTLRGDQCTSADAAGYPIAPLLFTADEVKAGAIEHAIRFILPNNRIKKGFVRPATHGSKTTGTGDLPYYGVHLRLRANYPIASLPTAGARVVARAMQKYGMYHADGGNIALTAQSDRHTTAKWSGTLGSRDLAALKVEDFEVIDHGPAIPLTLDCVRN
jgi:hypothetical protein